MTLLVKAIKPSKINERAFFHEFTVEAIAVANDMLLDLELTTATWDHQPKLEKLISVRGRTGIEVFVGTDDEIYGFIDEGTNIGKQPYPIPKVLKPYPMKFKSGYRTKSVPNKLTSRRGGAFGETVRAMRVYHPGIKPRNFTRTLTKKWTKLYKRRMEGAMRRAAKASGHSAE